MSGSSVLRDINIVITRAEHQAQKQRELLTALGATVYHYPTIDIVPPLDTSALDVALQRAADGAFEWLVLTSGNTVRTLVERLDALDLPADALAGMRTAAVGLATAQVAKERLQVDIDIVPDEFTAAHLAEAMGVSAGTSVFLPQSAIARPALAEALQNSGAEVTAVEAYRNVIARGGDPVPHMLWEGKIDAITFTSESTVRYFYKRLTLEQGTLAMLDDVVVACIGPVTAAAAEQFMLNVHVMPEQHTIEGLVTALADYFEGAGANR